MKHINPAPDITPTTSWPGLNPAIPVGRAPRFRHRDHRDKPGDDVGGECQG
ncbi:hypothetical protein J4G37_11720 [Microvirga sp. 3-52]|nr:hypothetical protein [Microvirga sp. 3-52]